MMMIIMQEVYKIIIILFALYIAFVHVTYIKFKYGQNFPLQNLKQNYHNYKNIPTIFYQRRG